MKPIAITFLWLTGIGFAAQSQTTQQLIDSARYNRLYNYSKIISFAQLAYKQALQKKQPALIGRSEYLIGFGNYMGGNYQQALNWYFKAEGTYNTIGDTLDMAELYTDMCIMYLKIKKYNEANEVSKKSITCALALNNPDKLATAINSRGLLFLDEAKNDSAITAFTSSYNLYHKINNKTGMAYSLDYLSSAQSEKGMYAQALISMTKSKTLRQGIGDKTGEAIAINNLGELYLKQNKPRDAAPYFIAAIAKAHELKFMDLESYAYKMLAQTYKQTRDYKNAFTAQSKYLELSQKIQDEKRVKAIEELQTQYATNKKEQQNRILLEQNKIQQITLSRNRVGIYALIALVIFTIVLFYLLYSRYKLNQQSKFNAAILNEQKMRAKGIIDAEENERQRLSQELHDGIGQLFTIVKMNMEILVERFLIKQPYASLLAEKTMAMVDESCTEVRSIAHQMMPAALMKGGLVEALKDFTNKIPSDKLKISIETQGIKNQLESSTETVLYRVIQESVNNVIKHACASKLDILLLCDEQEITVSIEDNGKGFDTGDKSKFRGIGLKNMVSRIEYLKGTVDISSAPGKGTLVAIYIPLN